MDSPRSTLQQLIAAISLACAALPVVAAPIPVIEYLLNEGSGTVATNSGSLGAANHGGINGTTSYSVSTPQGSAFSLDLSGGGDYIRIPNFAFGVATSVEAWINPNATAGQTVIFDDYGNPGVLMTIASGLLQWNLSTASDPGLGKSIFAGTIVTGAWQHVAGTYDGSVMRAYINGVLVGSAAASGNIQDNPTGQPTIGSDDVSTLLNYDGLIDDFRIFEVALTCQELAGGFFASQCQTGQGLPEPGTLLLVSMGLLGNLARRRRA